MKLFSVLEIDANYLYYDTLVKEHDYMLSAEETMIIKQIRALDSYGKTLVGTVIDLESKRVCALK